MAGKTVFIVTRTGLGATAASDAAFGSDMLDKLLHTLESPTHRPHAICFYTEGAKVTCTGSPHLVGLKLLEGLGVQLVTCQTCLDYYGLADQLAVGQAGGMVDIVACMTAAARVVTV
jgi:sulfur relay (sulfurtransferase) complex TusBCD TusD component (DsrE family)